MAKQNITRCDHGNEMSMGVLTELPQSTLGHGRDRCAICAYKAGAGFKQKLQPPGPVDVRKTCAAISNQVKLLRASRATFPYMPPSVVGHDSVQTAPYYLAHGHHITFSFQAPITESTRTQVNEIGYWINQNFILRLYATLEAGQIIGSHIQIKHAIDGSKEIELLRRLRNKFSHGSGLYRANVSNDQKIRKALMDHFGVGDREPPDSSGWFPIPIQGVLVKLAEGCERYVRALGPQSLV